MLHKKLPIVSAAELWLEAKYVPQHNPQSQSKPAVQQSEESSGRISSYFISEHHSVIKTCSDLKQFKTELHFIYE